MFLQGAAVKRAVGTSLVVQGLRPHLPVLRCGFDPGRGAEIPHALQPKNQNIKQEQYCNKINKGFKNDPHLLCLLHWQRGSLPPAHLGSTEGGLVGQIKTLKKIAIKKPHNPAGDVIL